MQPTDTPTAAERATLRANATRVLAASQIPDILREINRGALKGRGWFDEYDSGVIMKWGTGYTRRHLWVDIQGDTVRVRLRQHRVCDPATTPAVCDGEYHGFTPAQWGDVALMKEQMKYYYDHPVAESSDD